MIKVFKFALATISLIISIIAPLFFLFLSTQTYNSQGQISNLSSLLSLIIPITCVLYIIFEIYVYTVYIKTNKNKFFWLSLLPLLSILYPIIRAVYLLGTYGLG
jgi:hypothetical protein